MYDQQLNHANERKTVTIQSEKGRHARNSVEIARKKNGGNKILLTN